MFFVWCKYDQFWNSSFFYHVLLSPECWTLHERRIGCYRQIIFFNIANFIMHAFQASFCQFSWSILTLTLRTLMKTPNENKLRFAVCVISHNIVISSYFVWEMKLFLSLNDMQKEQKICDWQTSSSKPTQWIIMHLRRHV